MAVSFPDYDAQRGRVHARPRARLRGRALQTTARATSQAAWQIEVLTARTHREIDDAFAKLMQRRLDALLVGAHGLFNNRRVALVTLAACHAVPAMYPTHEFTEIGGLMSYGANQAD
jgi:hypothetical protein